MKNKRLHHDKTAGYKVPKGYFDKVEDGVMSQLASENLPKSTGFKVPNSYFSDVEEDILFKIEVTSDTKVRPLGLSKTFYYISGLAAALLLFFAVYNYNSSADDISIDMVESYFETYSMDSYELAELLIESKLMSIDDIKFEPEIDDLELESYLLENADIETIIIQ